MKTNTGKSEMANGIQRFEKQTGARAAQQMMRYNSGACRYEIECAFNVLQRTASAMPDANTDELQELVAASSAANTVLTAYLALGNATSAWLPTSVNDVINVPFEMALLQAMSNFDEAVAALKRHL